MYECEIVDYSFSFNIFRKFGERCDILMKLEEWLGSLISSLAFIVTFQIVIKPILNVYRDVNLTVLFFKKK